MLTGLSAPEWIALGLVVAIAIPLYVGARRRAGVSPLAADPAR